jgi:hypothetical protein
MLPIKKHERMLVLARKCMALAGRYYNLGQDEAGNRMYNRANWFAWQAVSEFGGGVTR